MEGPEIYDNILSSKTSHCWKRFLATFVCLIIMFIHAKNKRECFFHQINV